MPANIRPTSPRGIIPIPTARRLMPRSTTPKRADLFANDRCRSQCRSKSKNVERAKSRRSTFNPINTKKIGTSTVLTGCNRS
jgi:hypothetical protein